MATNKHAILRYKALDKCFRNKYRKFYLADLINYCNQYLHEHASADISISRRQIFDDINFMKSEGGYNAPILSIKDGRKVFYRYEDPDFSIDKSPINPIELEQIYTAVEIFSRIQGLPNFEWISELATKLTDAVDLRPKTIIAYESNPYLKGLEFLPLLYQYIYNEAVLHITYKSFKSEENTHYIIHPYFLKQYNSRWFLFGWNHERQALQNLALDRMLKIDIEEEMLYEPSSIDFQEYFEDIIGVSNDENAPVDTVILQLSDHIIPYIQSKPLHGSQKINGNTLELNVKLNYELESLLLSYGEHIRVLQPRVLKDCLTERTKHMRKFY